MQTSRRIEDGGPAKANVHAKAPGCEYPPSSNPSDAAGQQRRTNGQLVITRPSDPSIVRQLRYQQVRRRGYIKSIGRLHNVALARARYCLGWRWDMPETERKKINARAAAIVQALYGGKEAKPADREVADLIATDVLTYQASQEPLVKARAQVEGDMRRLARQLPVWSWVGSVPGFGDLALAVCVGEAGDLVGYPDTGRLWKRFGLAPYEGRAASTWRLHGGLSAEEWEAFGYAPRRNAESYAVLGDPLFKYQWAAERGPNGEKLKPDEKGRAENIPAHATGPYGEVYSREKARFLATGKTAKHADMHGLRCMRKAAIEDLWRVWNGKQPKERLFTHFEA